MFVLRTQKYRLCVWVAEIINVTYVKQIVNIVRNVKERFKSGAEISTFTQPVNVYHRAQPNKKEVHSRPDFAVLLDVTVIILSRHV